jgi:hypothetical protein
LRQSRQRRRRAVNECLRRPRRRGACSAILDPITLLSVHTPLSVTHNADEPATLA